MPRSTKVTLSRAEIADMIAQAIAADRASTPRASSQSSHWSDQDLLCPKRGQMIRRAGADVACDFAGRTEKGLAWHVENVKHAKAK